ncbi:MAG: response regulator transcription factor, partial [Ignavibacteria bacterium]|nr:response regulator transcription factor [Ignavibacteria bacterium]
LELGADDYISKPISIKKLLARIKNILRRQAPSEVATTEIIEIENLIIDTANYLAKLDGEEISFTKKEFEILIHLVRNRGRIVTREKLLDKIWGEEILVGQRTIDVHIRKIREKLGKYSDYIETIKAVGYRFKK